MPQLYEGPILFPITKAMGWFTGDDWTVDITVYGSDGVTPEDVTAWSFEWFITDKAPTAGADPKFTKRTSPATGITLTTPASGLIRLTVAGTLTDDVPGAEYEHWLYRTGSGTRRLLAYGPAWLQQSPTAAA